MKKVAAFVGSARKEGYCAQTVQQLKKGAESLGAEVEVFTLSDLNLKPCHGCMYCRQEKGCSIRDDDMQKIYEVLKEADAVVLAAPIYFAQMSGQTLTFINRLYPTIGAKGPLNGTKKAVVIYAYGAPGDTYYKEYIDYTAPAYKALGFDVQKTIICSDTVSGSAADDEALMKEAYEAGQDLVR